MTLKDIRSVVLSYYTDKGLRKIPVGLVARRELKQETIDFLRDFVRFLLTTDYMPEETLMYITHDYWTFKTIEEHPKFEDVPNSTIDYRLASSIAKLNRSFSEGMLVQLLDYAASPKPYREVLNRLIQKHALPTQFRKSYDIRLPDLEEGKPVEWSRVERLLEELKPYRKDNIKKVLGSLDTEALAYVYHLLGDNALDGERRDRAQLRDLIGG